MYYQRIKDCREDADLKQSDVAKMLKTTQQTYSLWETGKREIPVMHIITLARCYRVSTDYLLGLTNDKKGTWVK